MMIDDDVFLALTRFRFSLVIVWYVLIMWYEVFYVLMKSFLNIDYGYTVYVL